ncbi:MAG TPA: MFS transporter [Terriglobales bacterium]|nr:MFS transporter [Terriglobales bacterium]
MKATAGVGITVLLATALAPLNATMIVVALPRVMADLHAGAGASSMLVTGYLAAMAVLPAAGGRLGDRLGRRAALLAGLSVFGAAAAGAATAGDLRVLVACRIAQAAGGALAFPNALALLRERVTDARRGLAFGVLGAAMALAAAAGPPLGQLLVSHGGWRWVFLVNLPLAGLALAAVTVSLPPAPRGAVRPPRRAAQGGEPGLLRNRGLAAATLAIALGNAALYAALVGLPLLLAGSGAGAQGALLVTGLLAAAALVAPVAGRLADLWGRRFAAVLGLCVLAAGLLPIAVGGPHLGLRAMAAMLAVAGAGLGAASTAIQTGGVETVAAARAGTAAGLLSTGRYAGGAAGSGLVPVLLAVTPVGALNALFAAAAAAALLGALAGTGLGAGARPPIR